MVTVTQGYIYGMLSGGILFWLVGTVLETLYPPKCRWCKRKADK